MNNNRQPGSGRRVPPRTGSADHNLNGKQQRPQGNPAQGGMQARNAQGRRTQAPVGQGRGAAQQQDRARMPQGSRSVQGSSMSRITNQNPNQRRSEPKRVKMTAEQIEINKSNRRREKYHIKKRRSAMIKAYLSRFMMFLAVFAVMAAACGALFYLNLTRSDAESVSRYSYTIGEQRYSLSGTKAMRDGRVYVSFTDIAEMCGLAVVGSVEDMKYVIKGDEAETIRFVTDSRVVFVNDVETRLGSECYYADDELYVPVNFVDVYFKGLDVTVDERSHRVTITRQITNLNENGKLDKGVEAEYAELSFLLQSPHGLEPLDEKAEALADMPNLGFLTNLTIYEDYMNPGNTTEFLTLVNADNKLESDYAPQDLMTVTSATENGGETQLLRENAAMSLEAMLRELRAAGIEGVGVASAYRSYSYQEYLHGSAQNGIGQAACMSAAAGASEHQTGLSVDLEYIEPSEEDGEIIPYDESDVLRWLRDNCWKFGYILRYPTDKTGVTGTSYEPWHYRYVGRYHAQRMYQANMSLEEYVEFAGMQS